MTRANTARFMLLMPMARRSESANCRISKLAPFRYILDSLCVFEKVGLVLQKIVDMSCHSVVVHKVIFSFQFQTSD